MRTFLSIAFCAAVALIMITFTNVQAGKKGKDKGNSPAMVDLELTGTVVSVQHEKKGKDGGKHTFTRYYLETEDGKIHLPDANCKKGEDADYKLADFDGAKVTISAKGYTVASKKNGEASTHIKHIAKIARVEIEA